MRQLAGIIDQAAGPWLTVVTADDAVLTIDLDEAREAQAKILAGFGIHDDRSPDLVTSAD